VSQPVLSLVEFSSSLGASSNLGETSYLSLLRFLHACLLSFTPVGVEGQVCISARHRHTDVIEDAM
jgi:hypothetical protein